MSKQTTEHRDRDHRVRQDRVRQIDVSPNYRDRTGLVSSNPEVASNLLKITQCLANGDLIPEVFYRNRIDQTEDELLDELGIKHLHLHEDTGVDALLFFVEYRDFVLYLEVDHHRDHFHDPVGAVLASTHANAIRGADAKAAARAQLLREKVKRGLLPKRQRRDEPKS